MRAITMSLIALPAVLSIACMAAAQVQTPPVPTARPPYRVGAVTVVNGPNSRGGTLTLPEGPGPFTAVVLAGRRRGSKHAATVADHLTRKNIAVFHYDEGDVTADDLRAAVTQLQSIPTIHAGRIGVFGYADGVSAAETAATGVGPTFVVLVVGNDAAASPRVRIPIFRATGQSTDAAVTSLLPEIATWILEHQRQPGQP
jgi:hypothetical protein